MKLVNIDHFINKKTSNKAIFDYCMSIRGEIFKATKGRTVYRFAHGDRSYFIKIHTGVGWREIFKNLFQGKWPVLGAENEWKALMRLKALGLNTLAPVAMGVRGLNPALQQSFIITEELRDTVSLEWLATQALPVFIKRALIVTLANVMRIMHEGGVNHRDCYLCHFRLYMPKGIAALDAQHLILYVIDLHRAQIRKKVPMRWRVKDIAGLVFSSKVLELTRGDKMRFIAAYTGVTARKALREQQVFWQAVHNASNTLYQKQQRKK